MVRLFPSHHAHQLNLCRLRCHWFHSFHWNPTDLAHPLHHFLQDPLILPGLLLLLHLEHLPHQHYHSYRPFPLRLSLHVHLVDLLVLQQWTQWKHSLHLFHFFHRFRLFH
jgi:hypothetical protein